MSINISKIKDTDPASAATFNKPLSQIEAILNRLHNDVNTSGSKSAIVYNNAPISSDCFIGALVYLDGDVLRPASATYDPADMKSGRYINAPKSDVVGMVVAKQGASIGTVLVQGAYDSLACVAGCGISDGTGTYYLSETHPGMVTKDNSGIVRQPVLTYMGGASFILNITSRPPYQYDSTVVRGVYSESPSITTSTDDNGIVRIGSSDLISTGIELSQTAISSINGNRYTTTPIVSSISGVGGVSVTTNNLGEAFIGLSSELGHNIQASEYNLNGTKRVSDDIYTYIVFPSGKSSSVTISRHIDVSCEMLATPWVHVISGDAITFTTMSYFVPDPDKTIGVSPTDIRGVSSDIPVESSGSNIILGESSDSVSVVSSGTLISKITINSPSTDIKLLRAGYFMTPVAGASLLPEYSKNDALIASGIAGEAVSKDSVIGLNKDGRIVLASCADDSIPIAGISLNSVPVGGICKYTTYGHHKTDNVLSQNSTYYVGLGGALTSMAPDIPNYEQRVGEAIGDNILRVDIEERVY